MSLGLEVRCLLCNLQVFMFVFYMYNSTGIVMHIPSGTNILLSTYRDTSDALNYIAAGGKSIDVHHTSFIAELLNTVILFCL